MAKAIKTLAIVSAFALVISSFGACSLPFGNNDPTTEVTTTEKQTEPTEPETTAETETETTTEAPKKIDTIKDIFADINNFPIGTAGSSAKAASLALRLIAFSNSDLAESVTLLHHAPVVFRHIVGTIISVLLYWNKSSGSTFRRSYR